MPESMGLATVGGIALTGVGLKLVTVLFALIVMTAFRKVFNGKQGVSNAWIEDAKAKGQYMPIAVYQCVMFAATCYLIGSIFS